jgi:hypothetical protein
MVVMIRPPRSIGPYADRDLDCQEAIEEHFLAEVRAAGTAFLDLARIRAAISEDAIQAGWTKEDLDEALPELARCYALKVTPRFDRDRANHRSGNFGI